MATTPLQALPVPSLGDTPNGPAQFLALGTALEKQLVMKYASVAARDAAIPVPVAGMECYTTAEDTFWYYGTAWTARYAYGRMGSALVVADQAGITALADLTGFTVTFNAIAGRIYRVDYAFGTSQFTTPGAQTIRLSDVYAVGPVTTDLSVVDAVTAVAVGVGRMVTGFKEVPGLAAGSHTLKLRGTTSAGTMTITSAAAVNGRFAVYDVGI